MCVSDFHWLGIGNGAVSLAFEWDPWGRHGYGRALQGGRLMCRNVRWCQTWGLIFFVDVII